MFSKSLVITILSLSNISTFVLSITLTGFKIYVIGKNELIIICFASCPFLLILQIELKSIFIS